MSRAGYCAMCGRNAYLNPDGTCVGGHPADQVTSIYEVPDAAAPAYAAAPGGYAPQTEPRRRRTGLVVALVIVALLLLCGCVVGAFLLVPGARSLLTPTTQEDGVPLTSTSEEYRKNSADHARLFAAWNFLLGMGTGDATLFASVMPAASVAAAEPSVWEGMVESGRTEPTTFGDPKISGARLTASYEASGGNPEKGTLELTLTGSDQVLVVVKPEASEPSEGTITLVSEPDGWKVLTFDTDGESQSFDVEGLKATSP
jgi:hypothetical protein